ncbi:MAG: hypothetical protein H6733_06305 [Alphaproteobacteria bacterium]|nr:hypothetical protein [Alphaproteobacteria bacterium]
MPAPASPTPLAAQAAALADKLAGLDAWLDSTVRQARTDVAALERAVGGDLSLLRRFDGDVRHLMGLVHEIERVRGDLARRARVASARPEVLVGATEQVRDVLAARRQLTELHARVLVQVEAQLRRPIGPQRPLTCTLPDA